MDQLIWTCIMCQLFDFVAILSSLKRNTELVNEIILLLEKIKQLFVHLVHSLLLIANVVGVAPKVNASSVVVSLTADEERKHVPIALQKFNHLWHIKSIKDTFPICIFHFFNL